MNSKVYIKRISIGLVVVLGILICIEGGLRIAGFKPYEDNFASLEMTPRWMYETDSALGLKTLPGVYNITELGQYNYTATINPEGYRINPKLDSLTTSESPQIIFFGAGSTFGQGLNDEEAYPFVLQSMAPQYRVRNEAVMGYGVANNYVRLKRLKNYKKGDIIVYIYHADQDNRYRQANQKGIYGTFSQHPQFSDYHYLSIDENLKTSLHKYDYKLWPISRYSAISNYLEDRYNNYVDSKDNSNAIARKAILEMDKWSKAEGLDFRLVCWKSDALSLETIDYLKKNGVNTYHIPYVIGFDHIPKEELAPANRAFADSLLHVLHLEQTNIDSELK